MCEHADMPVEASLPARISPREQPPRIKRLHICAGGVSRSRSRKRRQEQRPQQESGRQHAAERRQLERIRSSLACRMIVNADNFEQQYECRAVSATMLSAGRAMAAEDIASRQSYRQ